MRSVVSISLPDKVASELDAYARDTGRNKSDIIRESLSLYLWETKFSGLKRKLAARAKKKGLVTEDDVFKEVS